MGKLRIGDKVISENVNAIVDTGTSLLVGPTDKVQEIQNQIGGFPIAPGEYVVLCNLVPHLPTVKITLGGQEFDLKYVYDAYKHF